MKKLIQGDLHGNFTYLEHIVTKDPDIESITNVGDLGIGFPGLFEPPFSSPVPVYFIRGNHDNPDFIKNLPQAWKDANFHYIPDGTIRDGVLYIGGAWSIDYRMRTPGLDWWHDEELNESEKDEIYSKIQNYDGIINTVVTHDAPYSLYPMLNVYNPNPSSTSAFLEELRQDILVGLKKPNYWYYGHHHKNLTTKIDGITFECLAPQAYKEIK